MTREMNVSEQINVHVVEQEESDLSDVIVELTVTAGKKNAYHIYFPRLIARVWRR